MLFEFTDFDLLCVSFKLSYIMISWISHFQSAMLWSLLPLFLPQPHLTPWSSQELCWPSGSLMEKNEYMVCCFLLKKNQLIIH